MRGSEILTRIATLSANISRRKRLGLPTIGYEVERNMARKELMKLPTIPLKGYDNEQDLPNQ